MIRKKGMIGRALAVALGLVFMAPSAAEAGNAAANKVTLCHNGKLVTVGPIAAAWHMLIHGDQVGWCGEPPPPPDGGGGF